MKSASKIIVVPIELELSFAIGTFLLTMTSLTESFNLPKYTPLYENNKMRDKNAVETTQSPYALRGDITPKRHLIFSDVIVM